MTTTTAARETRTPKKRRTDPPRRTAPVTDNPLLSAGRPLSVLVLRSLERHLGHTLADIRIHDDDEAAQLTDAAGAEAFVLGSHVFFAAGRFDVSTEPGRRLLAHEAAHVVQNRRGGLAPDHLVPCHEADAEHAAARDWLPDKTIPDGPAPTDGQGAVSLPALELPALRYSGGAATGSKGTVKVADLVLRMISRTLRLDPEDRNGRVRAQLARLVPDVREQVIDLARATLSAADYTRLETVLDKAAPAAEISTPVVGADPDDVADAEKARATPDHEHAQTDETTHTHADGTTHTHGDGEAHTHDYDGAKKRGGLLAGILGFLFGGPILSRSATAHTDTKTPDAQRVPAKTAPALAEKKDEPAAAPVTDEQDQLAEGKPAPVGLKTPEKEPPKDAAGGPPADPGSAPGSPDPRVSEPEAAKNEVAAGASGGSGGAPAAAEQPSTEEAAPQDKKADAEDRTVLEAHGHDMEAQAASPAAPNETDGPEAAEAEGAAPEPAASEGATAEPAATEGAAPEPAATSPEPAEQDGVPAESGPSEPATPAETANTTTEPSETQAGEPEPPSPTATEPPTTAADETVGTATEPAAAQPTAPETATPEEAPPAQSVPPDVEADNAGPEGQPEEAGPEAQGAEGGGPAACMGGGAEAAKPPESEADGPSGACGGGGGAAGGDTPEAPATPDVSGSTPDAALATVSSLPATDMQNALPQVGTAATADVSKQRDAMPPPTMDRPSGAAAGLDVSAPIPQRAVTPYTGPAKPDKVDTPAGTPTDDPDLTPIPSPSAKQVTVRAPRLGGDQQLSEADAARVAESIDEVPVSDPELAVDAGDPGAVALEADADPALVAKQKAALDGQIADAATQGANDAAAPLGEADIRPHVPPKTLTAAPDQGASCPGLDRGKGNAANAANSKYPKVALDAIAAEKSKGDIQAGVTKASSDFQAARDKRDADTEQAQADAKQKMDDAVTENNGEQVTLRRDAIHTSTTLRGQWTDEQHKAVDEAVDKSETATHTATTDIGNHKRKADEAAQTHIDDGNREIKTAREDAERKAREKKADAKKEKSGILSWIGSKVASFFDALKSAITGFFDIARKLVRKAIDGAKKLAHEAIELGRKAVVGAIKIAGDVIIAAGDVVLAAFPETRAKFREKVTEVVDTATQKVNDAADALERGIQALLDGLAAALDCALQYLQAGYLAAVDVLASVVKAALDAAQAFLDLLAEWAAIVADVAGNPIGWLKNLGRAAIDGVRNCLWGALKRAVKQWFNDKVEEVIGVGKMILNILLKGCLKFADIARMAWDAIKAALPGILIQLIIEKLVSLLIPAGAALMLIIDGLRAAWGAASRILAAFQKFMAFLKAVKSGSAAGAFAELIAAAGVAVLDFISNFLIGRLKGAGKGVGGTLKKMAERIGKSLGKVGRAIGRGVRAVGRGLVRGAKAGAGLVKRGAAAVVRGGKRVVAAIGRGVRKVGAMVPRSIARGVRAVGRAVDPRRLARAIARSRLAKAIGRGYSKVKTTAKDKWNKAKDRLKKKWEEYKAKKEQRRKEKERKAEELRRRAPGETRQAIERLLSAGVGRVRLMASLFLLKRKYRWKQLRLESHPKSHDFKVVGSLSPPQTVTVGSISIVPTGITTRQVPSEVRTFAGPQATTSGKHYEQAVGQEFVPELAKELFPGKKAVVTVPWKPRAKSSLTQVAIDAQKEQRKAKLPGQAGGFRPDWVAEVYDRDPVTGRKIEHPTEVHAIEATLVSDWSYGKFGEHKQKQSWGTLAALASRYRNSKITYHIVCPERPSPETRAYIEQEVLAAGKANGAQVRVVWRVVGFVSAAGGAA
ncbi:hypothetical protein Mycsm_06562 (plasmid) [Mycobacterium sp. JS623]|uniref:eCIS core domain-containing protein n=1 Tax=Mycobacterium sp. JS623 TaxID=212767 RepID=UPI0002A558FE|nr:DUF4157 domain-containing protein [Mycobacterium sp. JS623]AGB26699.1 hypothetical protein Mycsm_06562 [Mycobacterium sp. JS623]